jgi:hypothetical protein
MSPLVKNILAVAAGVAIGWIVNMGLIMLSGSIIPPPPGTDFSTPEGLKAAMPLMEPKHFIMPFLAHALGTLAGAWVATAIAASHKMIFAMIIGGLFFLGGIGMVMMVPGAPGWFIALDLIVAYIPMAYIGYKLGSRNKARMATA